nr:translation initiation factor IF-2-like [Gorilla gorilla gorilla]
MQKPGLFSKQDAGRRRTAGPGGGVSATPGSGAERRDPEWVGPDVQAPPGARFRARVTAARPGRCGCCWGRRIRERCRALSGPRRPRPSSGNRCPPRKGRKNCSARKGEELRGEARPSSGQRPAAGVRPHPLGRRRARGALGTADTHAPPATERRGARARRPRGRGAGGGGAVWWTLARARGDSSLRDSRIVEGRGGSSPGRRDTGILGNLPSRVPLQAAIPGGGGASLRRRSRHWVLAAGEGEHGSGDSCVWRRDTAFRWRDLFRVPGPGLRSGMERVPRPCGTFFPWRRCTARRGAFLAEVSVRGPRPFPARSHLGPLVGPGVGEVHVVDPDEKGGHRGLGARVQPARPQLALFWCCPVPEFIDPAFPLLSTYYVPGCALRM